MRFSSIVALVFCGVFAATSPSTARADEAGRNASRWQVAGGIDPAYGIATGDFARAVDHGWGALGRAALFRGGTPLGLALETSLLEYGRDKTRRALFPDTDRVLVDVTTSNWIGHLSVGPELARRSGSVRPYLQALVGVSYFDTSTDVEGSSNAAPFATTTHLDDLKLCAVLGGGVRIPFGHKSRVALDLNARYWLNGKADYLVEGDIREDPQGHVEFTPRRTSANLFVIGIGLTFGQ